MSLKAYLSRQSYRPRPNYHTGNLPSPNAFYARFGLVVRGNGWCKVKCPFHDDTRPSMAVNATHGGFICHACGAKGSMIGFYMQYHGVDYKTAITAITGGAV